MHSQREMREELEKIIISDHGVKSSLSRGRPCPEEPCAVRTCFQRDIDRITHSKAFRRLKDKTQVFLQPEGDHYRTRLTHTLEVSRIARTIARALRLNEDLTEAIALGHDLGHTPFGHAGERALRELCSAGFEHNEQSLRVVDRLERDGLGLNLCHETRLGILNHNNNEIADNELEARVVRLSDRIAYINHDIDDAERAGILTAEDLPMIVRERIGERHSIRINAIITNVLENSGGGELKMSPDMAEAVETFRNFMFDAVYRNPIAKGEESKVLDILAGIWKYYVNHAELLPGEYHEIAESEGLERAVCDYISGMTDGYAISQYTDIYIPSSWKY